MLLHLAYVDAVEETMPSLQIQHLVSSEHEKSADEVVATKSSRDLDMEIKLKSSLEYKAPESINKLHVLNFSFNMNPFDGAVMVGLESNRNPAAKRGKEKSKIGIGNINEGILDERQKIAVEQLYPSPTESPSICSHVPTIEPTFMSSFSPTIVSTTEAPSVSPSEIRTSAPSQPYPASNKSTERPSPYPTAAPSTSSPVPIVASQPVSPLPPSPTTTTQTNPPPPPPPPPPSSKYDKTEALLIYTAAAVILLAAVLVLCSCGITWRYHERERINHTKGAAYRIYHSQSCGDPAGRRSFPADTANDDLPDSLSVISTRRTLRYDDSPALVVARVVSPGPLGSLHSPSIRQYEEVPRGPNKKRDEFYLV